MTEKLLPASHQGYEGTTPGFLVGIKQKKMNIVVQQGYNADNN